MKPLPTQRQEPLSLCTESNQMSLTARVSKRFSEMMLRPPLQPWLYPEKPTAFVLSSHVTLPVGIETQFFPTHDSATTYLHNASCHVDHVKSSPNKYWASSLFQSFGLVDWCSSVSQQRERGFLGCQGPPSSFTFCFPDLKLERKELKFQTIVSFSYLSWMILM